LPKSVVLLPKLRLKREISDRDPLAFTIFSLGWSSAWRATEVEVTDNFSDIKDAIEQKHQPKMLQTDVYEQQWVRTWKFTQWSRRAEVDFR